VGTLRNDLRRNSSWIIFEDALDMDAVLSILVDLLHSELSEQVPEELADLLHNISTPIDRYVVDAVLAYLE
jgi:hypothetical protein